MVTLPQRASRQVDLPVHDEETQLTTHPHKHTTTHLGQAVSTALFTTLA
jgi:hypothetical protein